VRLFVAGVVADGFEGDEPQAMRAARGSRRRKRGRKYMRECYAGGRCEFKKR
jgi:hypothetical protein